MISRHLSNPCPFLCNPSLPLLCSFPQPGASSEYFRKFGEVGERWVSYASVGGPGPRVRPPGGLEGRLRDQAQLWRTGGPLGTQVASTAPTPARGGGRGTGSPRRAGSPRQIAGDACYSPSAVAIILRGLGAAAAPGREERLWKRGVVTEAHVAGKGRRPTDTPPARPSIPGRPHALSASNTACSHRTPEGSATQEQLRLPAQAIPPETSRRAGAETQAAPPHPPPCAGAVPEEAKSGARWRPLPILQRLADQLPSPRREQIIGWSVPSSDGRGKACEEGHTKFTSSGTEVTLTLLLSSPQSWVLENNGDFHVQRKYVPAGSRRRTSSTPSSLDSSSQPRSLSLPPHS